MAQIGIGKTAADFETAAVVNGEIKTLKMSDYRGKYCVFFWYPLDFTFVCPTEIIAFSEAAKRFREIGCEVIGASCDSEFSHLAWINTPREKGGLGFMDIPIISDFSKEIAKEYGVLLPGGVPARATFVIDDKGTIRSVVCNDPPVGRNVDEILRLVQAFQYTDVHGEVCPANWTPGAKTMQADPEKSLEYFASGATATASTKEEGDIAEVGSTEDFQSAISGSTPVVVQFSAAWCGKCKALYPHVVRMSKENTGLKFLRVDVNKLHDLADTSGVTALPTVQVYKNGNLLSAYTGSSAEEVAKLVQSAGSA